MHAYIISTVIYDDSTTILQYIRIITILFVLQIELIMHNTYIYTYSSLMFSV